MIYIKTKSYCFKVSTDLLQGPEIFCPFPIQFAQKYLENVTWEKYFLHYVTCFVYTKRHTDNTSFDRNKCQNN